MLQFQISDCGVKFQVFLLRPPGFGGRAGFRRSKNAETPFGNVKAESQILNTKHKIQNTNPENHNAQRVQGELIWIKFL